MAFHITHLPDHRACRCAVMWNKNGADVKKLWRIFFRKPSAEELALREVRSKTRMYEQNATPSRLISHTIKPIEIDGRWTTMKITY